MKRFLSFSAVLILLLYSCALTSAAFDGNIDSYREDTEDSLFSALDSETAETLGSFGIDSLDFSKIYNVSWTSVRDYFGQTLIEKAENTSAVFFELLFAVIVTACAGKLMSDESNDAFELISAAAVSMICVGGIYRTVNAVISVLSLSSGFMKSFIPIFAGIVAFSGSPASALTYNTLTLGLAEVISALSGGAAIKFIGAFFCLSIAFSVNGAVSVNRLVSAFGKAVSVSFGLISSLFAGILGVKGTLAASLDRANVKSVKFLISSMIPVVGSSISEAYSSIVGSINLIKSSAAAVGILSAVIINIPALAEALLCRCSLSTLSVVSELLGCQRISVLLKCFACGIKVLLLLLVFEMFLIIISTGLILSFKGGE